MKILESKMRRKTENTNSLIFCLSMVAVAFMAMSFFGVAPVSARTYTTDADFDEGVLFGVEHATVHDQLQLSKKAVTLPFIWVPNQGQGTVSKVNTEAGDEIGRYRVAPRSNCSPSRTTVDLDGSCWVGLRQAGTVVKIGLYEAGQWIDRNSDGICQTSEDTNGDGDIKGAEIVVMDDFESYEVGTTPPDYDFGVFMGIWGLYWASHPNLWKIGLIGENKVLQYYHPDSSVHLPLVYMLHKTESPELKEA